MYSLNSLLFPIRKLRDKFNISTLKYAKGYTYNYTLSFKSSPILASYDTFLLCVNYLFNSMIKKNFNILMMWKMLREWLISATNQHLCSIKLFIILTILSWEIIYRRWSVKFNTIGNIIHKKLVLKFLRIHFFKCFINIKILMVVHFFFHFLKSFILFLNLIIDLLSFRIIINYWVIISFNHFKAFNFFWKLGYRITWTWSMNPACSIIKCKGWVIW